MGSYYSKRSCSKGCNIIDYDDFKHSEGSDTPAGTSCCDCKMNHSNIYSNYKKHCCIHKNNYKK